MDIRKTFLSGYPCEDKKYAKGENENDTSLDEGPYNFTLHRRLPVSLIRLECLMLRRPSRARKL